MVRGMPYLLVSMSLGLTNVCTCQELVRHIVQFMYCNSIGKIMKAKKNKQRTILKLKEVLVTVQALQGLKEG